MRGMMVGLTIVFCALSLSPASAEEKRRTGEQILGGVISGVLGQPAASPDAMFTAQEQERLTSLLQSGEYATSRQGEAVDMMVYGVPLTRTEHVYTAKPIQPSRAARPSQ